MTDEWSRPNRRTVLAGIGASVATTAGCLGGSTDSGVECETPATTQRVSSLPPAAIGPSSASVTVHAWEDLSCPHCKTFALDVVPKLREEYVSDGTVRFVRHDFPIPVSEWAWPAASALRAAQDAADAEALITVADTIYDNQSDYEESVLNEGAQKADVEPCTLLTAARTDKYRPVVENDKQRGVDRGVEGTPTVFVDDEQVSFGSEIAFGPVRDAIEQKL